jgi:DNA topoisomerase-3
MQLHLQPMHKAPLPTCPPLPPTPLPIPQTQAHVCRHLQQEGKGCDYLVLWLDCDREGENICFEVMDNVVPVMHKGAGGSARQVLRARFSAVSAPEVQAAMVRGGAFGGGSLVAV